MPSLGALTAPSARLRWSGSSGCPRGFRSRLTTRPGASDALRPGVSKRRAPPKSRSRSSTAAARWRRLPPRSSQPLGCDASAIQFVCRCHTLPCAAGPAALCWRTGRARRPEPQHGMAPILWKRCCGAHHRAQRSAPRHRQDAGRPLPQSAGGNPATMTRMRCAKPAAGAPQALHGAGNNGVAANVLVSA